MISLITPAAYYNELGLKEYYWMWGLYHVDISGYGTETLLMPLESPGRYMIPIFLSGIFSAFIIFLCSIISIISANKVRLNRKDPKVASSTWIGIGLLLIVSSIVYIIAINITMGDYIEYVLSQLPNGYIAPDFWDVYNPGFGIIGPFLGAAFSIIGAIAIKVAKPKEEISFPAEKKELVKEAPTDESITQYKYCPECGQKLLYSESKFCSYCGFELKS